MFAEMQKDIDEWSDRFVVFGMMRNEIIRLGNWLAHYRKIGCRHFVVVDNGSTDGTFEALQAEPDVLVVQNMASFGEAKFGIDWLNDFRRMMPPDRWVLFADADELLVYRGWPELGIETLIDEAEAAGGDAVWGFLLDMYPNGPIDPVDPPPGSDLFKLAPCFDSEYHFRFPPRKPWQKNFPDLEIVGGPRLRSISSLKRELRVTWVDRFLRGQLDRMLPHTPDRLLPALFRLFPQAMPTLFKSPLVKAAPGISYLNNHDLTGATYVRSNVAVCHFKFLGDFSRKVHSEVRRREHYRKGAEYFRYKDILSRNKTLDFRYAGSREFTSVALLAALGILTHHEVINPNTSAA